MLILASASPRRRELLGLITTEFVVSASEVDETVASDLPPAQVVEELARRKALAVLQQHLHDMVIGADTIVVLDGVVLGKPRTTAHAEEMLRMLSGRWHTVYTGVALAGKSGCESFVERADVEFTLLDEGMIRSYVATGEPMDKAGAYGIQGKGALLVRGIRGDFYTVMGLPVCRLAECLRGGQFVNF